jgi:hypothetical protein
MAQYARPDSDISKSNVSYSTGTDAYALVDETSYSDTDYFYYAGSSTMTCEMGLSSVDDPESSSGHVLRIRISKSSTFGSTPSVALKEGSTTIRSSTLGEPSSATTYEITLTTEEADSITDYGNLSVLVTFPGYIIPPTTRCYWIEFEVPDAPIKVGLEMGACF